MEYIWNHCLDLGAFIGHLEALLPKDFHFLLGFPDFQRYFQENH